MKNFLNFISDYNMNNKKNSVVLAMPLGDYHRSRKDEDESFILTPKDTLEMMKCLNDHEVINSIDPKKEDILANDTFYLGILAENLKKISNALQHKMDTILGFGSVHNIITTKKLNMDSRFVFIQLGERFDDDYSKRNDIKMRDSAWHHDLDWNMTNFMPPFYSECGYNNQSYLDDDVQYYDRTITEFTNKEVNIGRKFNFEIFDSVGSDVNYFSKYDENTNHNFYLETLGNLAINLLNVQNGINFDYLSKKGVKMMSRDELKGLYENITDKETPAGIDKLNIFKLVYAATMTMNMRYPLKIVGFYFLDNEEIDARYPNPYKKKYKDMFGKDEVKFKTLIVQVEVMPKKDRSPQWRGYNKLDCWGDFLHEPMKDFNY